MSCPSGNISLMTVSSLLDLNSFKTGPTAFALTWGKEGALVIYEGKAWSLLSPLPLVKNTAFPDLPIKMYFQTFLIFHTLL